jgi:hypothetical protein
MRPPEVFGLVVRVLGLTMTMYSLWSLVTNIAISMSVPGVDGITVWFVVTAIVGVVVGIYFLRGAPRLLRFSYPHGG